MLKITVIAVGKLKEAYWREAADEYLKRLKPYAQVSVIEVADAPDSRGVAGVLVKEEAAIRKATPADALSILLDSKGTTRSSENNAAWLHRHMLAGHSHLVFIIGGSHGVSEPVRASVDETISLGLLTLPHNLARIVLLEQIYRAFKIIRAEPYHK